MICDDMTCGRARRLLWPDAGPRAASPEVIAAQDHLAECTVCRQFMADMRALGKALHDAAPRDHAPAEVRGRVFTAVARARAGRRPPQSLRRLSFIAGAVAAAVVLAAVATTDQLLRDTTADPLSLIAADHARALGEARIASSDPSEVERWIGSRVHFAMQVPVLPGATLRGARLCLMDGRRGAAVEYEVNGVSLSYFVIPEQRGSSGTAMPRFASDARSGYRIVSWREPGLLHVMVADLPVSRLETFARACVEQAGRAVAWLEPWILPWSREG